MNETPTPPAWIHWPIRVLAVIFVLPFRLLWELLVVIGRFLARYVGRPLAWLFHHAVVVPVAWVWHYVVVVPISWLWRHLVVVPLEWLAHRLLVVPGRWLWARRRWALRPFGLLVRYLLVIPVVWFFTVTEPLWTALGQALVWTFTMIGRGIDAVAVLAYRWVLHPGWIGAGWVLRQAYRWLLRPVGLAIAWVWRHTVVPAYRMISASGRWVREAVLRPVLVSVGLRR
ncbi:hypothetical protein [Actinoplanes friuliensis]|uniref:Uncharacterized protein n=1 Tax=Actinoplanes friuliensis DSM 7358 TaxID=1246995 RepID=U5W7E2_9ACTN|nr:hypothetical protein [Actinoplanes friuliensis]AGZ43871.1 hypothetical protein AFR_28050 [Actinoplanes friuliensis DSM 7358]